MDKAIDHLKGELATIRTGRAQTALVEGLTIDQYGQTMSLKQVATLNTPDAHTIAITPWDRSNLPTIEKAIRESQSLGLTPNNDGQTIRLNVPPMTEERRKEIAKQVSAKAEGAHIAMRNIRHEIMEQVKRDAKAGAATQDDQKWAETELNRKIDRYRAKIEALERAKQAEILAV